MATSEGAADNLGQRLLRPAQLIVVGSVMFTFISYWRTAAVVLCDLASTAFYIGGIVEQAIGPAAPWFILGVMLFSYAVRWVYIESCALFVRGGAYRVVKEALGGFLAKLSVSALMFDFILTGPTSSVSAGQYIMGLVFDFLKITNPTMYEHWGLGNEESRRFFQRWFAVVIACGITFYFFWRNVRGIHESSNDAMKIMIATTIMAVVMLLWCGLTLIVRGPANSVPLTPDLNPKVEFETVIARDRVTGEKHEMWKRDPETQQLVPRMELAADGSPHVMPRKNEATGKQEDPLGFISGFFPGLAAKLRDHGQWSNWLGLIGVIGIMLAFGHSILAMSGEETLAQVYREVESPKLPNFKKAAFIVFVYSLLLTVSISFLAVLLIPDEIRMKVYSDNLIGGLAMYVLGPTWLRLMLNIFVVLVGAAILAGAVNTAIIGSNGVLNRVSEDGVLPDWFLKPHPRYGTTYRLLYAIVILKLVIIVASRGDMYVLGEAYAFGVVWSFVFVALAMVVLRFKDRSPREFKVPGNIKIRGVEIPLGLIAIFLVLLVTAVLNFLTKEVATIGGVLFTVVFLGLFTVSQRLHEQRLRGKPHEHLEQFNQQTAEEISPAGLSLTKPYRRLVAIRSPQNLFMLKQTLVETDPIITDTVVMTAKLEPPGGAQNIRTELDTYERQLLTAVVQLAEKAGKEVRPLIMPTNNPLYAVIHTAKDLKVQELVVGASNQYTADEQLEQIAFYWINMHDGQSVPLTVRILGRDRDVLFDLAGGNRIPKISDRKARSVAELRAAGVGVDRVLLAHDGSPENSDLYQSVLTMLDPQVALGLLPVIPPGTDCYNDPALVYQDQVRAKQLGRALEVHPAPAGDPASEIVRLAREAKYDLIILSVRPMTRSDAKPAVDVDYVLRNAPCVVFQASPAVIPQEPEANPPA